MREINVLCTKFNSRRKKYSSYKGTIGKIAPNTVNRKFKANAPGRLWLTDGTEFRRSGSEQKIYLSPILDIYNDEIISFSISNRPTTKLTNRCLEEALDTLLNYENLTIHSDQGFHYQHSSWVKTLEEKSITQSMSGKGNCLDNSPMENFFGIMKREMFYGETFNTNEDLIRAIKEYIAWYNTKRIKIKLKGL